MCSGKTTVGSLLGKQLNIPVIETDELIRQKAGKTTNEIFTDLGEVGYREYEITVSKGLKDINDAIISTGGGIVMNNITFAYIKPNAKVIFLRSSFVTLLERLKKSFSRPLFNDLKQAKKIYELRQPLYDFYADLTIDTDKKTPDEIVKEIKDKLQL